MSLTRRHFLATSVASAAALGMPISSVRAATAYPTLPFSTVKFISASSPGGGMDLFLREFARFLTPHVKVNTVVESVTGAGGARAFAQMAKEKADGSVLLGTTPTFVNIALLTTAQHSYKTMQPVANLFMDPQIAYVRADSPFKSLKDVVDFAKKNPGKLRWSTAGPANLDRQAVEKLKRVADINIIVASNTSGAEILLSVLSKAAEVGMGEAQELAGQVEAGELRLLATFTEDRLARFPDLPTAREQGVDVIARKFRGLAAPLGTPVEVLDTWSEICRNLMEDPAYKTWWTAGGLIPSFMDHKKYSEFLVSYASESEAYYREMGLMK
jgi:putative tricarboxylic transport membrane protein